jgi:hypothetical protein
VTPHRWLVAAACVIVAAVLVVIVGRAELASERRKEIDGIALVRSLVGGKIAKPVNFRVSPDLYCLIYESGGRPIALELCADRYGRIVEAVDRRGSLPVFYNITFEPQVATEHIDMHFVAQAIARLEVTSK